MTGRRLRGLRVPAIMRFVGEFVSGATIMKQLFPALTIAFCLALTACDGPDQAASPNPVGNWEVRQQPGDATLSRRLEIRADGNFRRTGGVVSSSGQETATDTVSGSWRSEAVDPPSWWERFWPRRDQTEELMKTAGVSPKTSLRHSHGMITLSYWIPAKSEVPVGATVVEKKHIGPVLDGREQWLIREKSLLRLSTSQETGEAYLTVGRQTYRKVN